jgi:channel protein (hemolysin III family)
VAAYALLEDTLDPPGQRNLRMVLYVIAGWLGVIPFFTHYQCLPPAAWYLLGFGGIIFSCGTLLYQRANRAHPSRPTSYYILVVLAAGLHYSAIMRYAGAPTEACLASARGTLDVWSLLLSWLPGMA